MKYKFRRSSTDLQDPGLSELSRGVGLLRLTRVMEPLKQNISLLSKTICIGFPIFGKHGSQTRNNLMAASFSVVLDRARYRDLRQQYDHPEHI
jgi:hypothetical protein